MRTNHQKGREHVVDRDDASAGPGLLESVPLSAAQRIAKYCNEAAQEFLETDESTAGIGMSAIRSLASALADLESITDGPTRRVVDSALCNVIDALEAMRLSDLQKTLPGYVAHVGDSEKRRLGAILKLMGDPKQRAKAQVKKFWH